MTLDYDRRLRNSRRLNVALGTICVGLAAYIGFSSFSKKPDNQRGVKLYYIYEAEPRTYTMDVNRDDLIDRVHVSEFPPRIEIQNADGSFTQLPGWTPRGYEEHLSKRK